MVSRMSLVSLVSLVSLSSRVGQERQDSVDSVDTQDSQDTLDSRSLLTFLIGGWAVYSTPRNERRCRGHGPCSRRAARCDAAP